MAKTIQIRDVSDETYTILRTRAAEEHLSLSAYLRRQLDDMARPTMADILHNAERRRARDWHVSGADIVAAVRAVRDEDEA
jgi:antitoxin FitA